MPFPYIFTFYSYKGGVGRSMAVMNAAYTLAGRGRHVLVVDMDLEAPGISGFLHRSKELAEPNTGNPRDVLTLLGEAIRATEAQSIPPVSNYIRSVAEEKLDSLRPKLGTLGRLDVLGPDLDRDYLERLAQLGLKDLPQARLVGLSTMLHTFFKEQVFPHRPLGVESFEPPIPTHYDYVLVDSRTGITEIGGLCVGPVADRLVVITGLNDQNIQGTLDFFREAGIQPQPRSKRDGAWDEADTIRADETDNASLGPKPTILVASPAPVGEIAYKRSRLREIEKCLGIRPLSLSYHPQMALMESVFVRDYPEEFLAREYEELTTAAMAQVGDDPQTLASYADGFWNEQKEPAAAIARALRLTSHDPELGVALLGQLAPAIRRSSGKLVPEMRQLYAFLSHNPGTRLEALSNWGVGLAEQACTKIGDEADAFFEEASRKYTEALRIRPDFYEALNNWGVALAEQARTKAGAEADGLYEEASRKYSLALQIKPDFHEALANWGGALCDQAEMQTGDAAEKLSEEARQKYAEAIAIKPDFHATVHNQGNSLFEEAKTERGAEADRLFEQAHRKYAEALRLRPGYNAALLDWGTALYAQAQTKSEEERDRLLNESKRKFDESK